MQLEAEKAALLQKKREQQVERKRKQDELDRILQENKRKVDAIAHQPCLPSILKAINNITDMKAGGEGVAASPFSFRMEGDQERVWIFTIEYLQFAVLSNPGGGSAAKGSR